MDRKAAKDAKEMQVSQVNLIKPPICAKPDNLKKIFIDDTFYLVDDKYVYDTLNKQRVGYVQSKIQGQIEYILTDDPFVLSAF